MDVVWSDSPDWVPQDKLRTSMLYPILPGLECSPWLEFSESSCKTTGYGYHLLQMHTRGQHSNAFASCAWTLHGSNAAFLVAMVLW